MIANAHVKAGLTYDRVGITILRSWEHYVHRFLTSKHQLWFLGVFSFLESTVLPVPLESVYVPYLIKNPDRRWHSAIVVTISCLLGALTFYFVGMLAMQSIGHGFIELLASAQRFAEFKTVFAEQGFVLILATGVSPIPFQFAALVAGASEYPIGLFILAAVLARSLRYFGLVVVVNRYGDDAMDTWQQNKMKASVLALIVLLIFYGVMQGIRFWLMP